MAKAKILIVIEGGLIQNILTTDLDIEVAVIDYDRDAKDVAYVSPTEQFEGKWAETIKDSKYGLSDKEKSGRKLLAKFDKEYPLEGEVVGVAGFSQEDFETIAIEQGYVMTQDQLKDLTENYSYKHWDNGLSMGAWEQVELIVDMYAREHNIESQELNLVEEFAPEGSGEVETDLGLVMYDEKTDTYTKDGETVTPVWFK